MVSTIHREPCNTDLIAYALHRYPTRTAFDDGRVTYTYAAVADRISRMSAAMAAAGIGPDAGVAILAGNEVEAWSAMTAANFLGARVTALPTAGSPDADLHICDDANVGTLVASAGLGARAAHLQANAPALDTVFALGSDTDFPDLSALADRESASDLRRAPALDADAVARIQYTGGTTGRPKGVMLTHRSIVAGVNVLGMVGALPRAARYLAAAPITHAATLFIVPTLLGGGTVVLHPGFEPQAFLRCIDEQHITFTMGVPTMIYMLLDQPNIGEFDLSSLDTFFYGAAPMSPDRLADVVERFGRIFMQGYGQTESAGVGTILGREDHDPHDRRALGSCGRTAPTMHVELQDPEGRRVAPGEVGEVCISGPTVMSGYWQQPDQTAEAMRGGWLHTGDVGVETDGYLSIVDRTKDMIITGGFNVYPREVELALEEHPEVLRAAVIGQPDDKWGESVRAVVVLRPRSAVSVPVLKEFIRQSKGPVLTPKDVDVVPEIPLTGTGKVDKPSLRRLYNR